MKKIAILFSGNMRNVLDIQKNLNENLIDPLKSSGYEYDIFIHTWNSNASKDGIGKNDMYIKTNDIQYITTSLSKNFNVKKIIIEDQDKVYDLHGGDSNLNKIIGSRSIRKYNEDKTKKLLKGLYFQYYGQFKSLEIIEGDYDYIIKTRPDVWYFERFNVNLLKSLSFPHSHQFGGRNINQIFYVGPTDKMKKVLMFWKYLTTETHKTLEGYPKYDINLNMIFRHYVEKILEFTPNFVDYDPGLYRNKNKITTISK